MNIIYHCPNGNGLLSSNEFCLVYVELSICSLGFSLTAFSMVDLIRDRSRRGLCFSIEFSSLLVD